MREIKYRAWDLKENKMIYGTALIENDGKWFMQIGKYIDVWHEVDFVTQYTGLKDKNGKEIYEGDIITCSNGMAYQYEVEFVFGCFIGHDKATGFSKKLYDMKDLEVVGNIYENPELLDVIK